MGHAPLRAADTHTFTAGATFRIGGFDVQTVATPHDAAESVAVIVTADSGARTGVCYDLGHVPQWRRDRIVAIGDAAHAPAPSSGQGASMAMEDGVVLARCLRDGATVASALAAYEAARRTRVERIVAAGARSSSAKTPPALLRPLSDAVLRLVFRFAVTDRSTAWMYDHRIDWAAG